MEYILIVLFISLIFIILSVAFLIYNRNLKLSKNRVREEIEEEKKRLEADLKEKIELSEKVFKKESEKTAILLEQSKREAIAAIDHQRKLELQRINEEINREREEKEKLSAEEFEFRVQDLQDILEEKQIEVKDLIDLISDYRSKRATINEAIRREKEIKEQQDFYRVILSDVDKDDIKLLRTIESKLHNREALSKLIYEVFYKKPLGDMISRVLRGKEFCGIYKITNLDTQEAYIGKSTNIKTRWINHVKTSLDIGSIAKTRIHTALKDYGLDRFSFEVLEECSKEVYSERERYWIQFYDTQTYGYNIQK